MGVAGDFGGVFGLAGAFALSTMLMTESKVLTRWYGALPSAVSLVPHEAQSSRGLPFLSMAASDTNKADAILQSRSSIKDWNCMVGKFW